MKIRKFKNKDKNSLNILLNHFYNTNKLGKKRKKDIELVTIINNEVVGYMLLLYIQDPIKNYNYYYVNYICVKEEYQNKGIASKMFDEVFNICNKNNIKHLELTSNPSRLAARHLYQKNGFVIKNTNVFIKNI